MPTYTRTLDLSRTGQGSDRRPVTLSLLSPTAGRFTLTIRWNKRCHRNLRSRSALDGAYFFSYDDDAGQRRIAARRITICENMLATYQAGDSDIAPGVLRCEGPADPGVSDLGSGLCKITYEEEFDA